MYGGVGFDCFSGPKDLIAAIGLLANHDYYSDLRALTVNRSKLHLRAHNYCVIMVRLRPL